MVQFPDSRTVLEWRYGGGDKQGPIIGRLFYLIKVLEILRKINVLILLSTQIWCHICIYGTVKWNNSITIGIPSTFDSPHTPCKK